MIKTREQSLFDELYKRCLFLGYAVYDYKPSDDVSYPFVEFEDMQTTYIPNKTDVKGSVFLTVSVWGYSKKQRETLAMSHAILDQARTIEKTEGYAWSLNWRSSSIEMITDTSTVDTLKRGRISLEFYVR